MIDYKQYSILLNEGLILDHYFILYCIKHKLELPKTQRIFGLINLLVKKEYLDDANQLTEKSDMLFKGIGVIDTVKIFDNKTWILNSYEKCQAKIKELTGSIQVKANINGKKYPFLPNIFDFSKALTKVISSYRLKDNEAITKTLLLYIEKCNDSNNWFPLMQYYIFKQNTSQMATDLQNKDEDESTDDRYISNQKLI